MPLPLGQARLERIERGGAEHQDTVLAGTLARFYVPVCVNATDDARNRAFAAVLTKLDNYDRLVHCCLTPC
jgi:hypothetical protein